MTPSGRTFDLYLLSRMRADAAVDAALARLGATRAELVEAAAAERAGFEETLRGEEPATGESSMETLRQRLP